MQLNNRCLRCETTSDLNTIISVMVEGEKFEIALCGQHEGITPKQVRNLVLKKQKQYKDLVSKMKAFGVDVDSIETSSEGVLVVPPKDEPVLVEQPVEQEPVERPNQKVVQEVVQQPIEGRSEQAPVVEGKLAKQQNLSVQPVAGQAKGHAVDVNVESRTSVDVNDAVAREVQAAKDEGKLAKDAPTEFISNVTETQVVRGRGGQPMTIPKVIKHNIGGNTVINIVDTGGDQTIQDRTRALAQEEKPYSFASQGFDVQDCTMCKGSGMTTINNSECPKCKGTGILNKGR